MPSKAAIVRRHATIDETANTWTCNQCVTDNESLGTEVQPLKVYSYSGGTSNIVRHFSEFHPETFNLSLDSKSIESPPAHVAKIREYYDLIAENTYSCSLCQKNVKSVTTSNLLFHFRKYHESAYNEYVKVSTKKRKRSSKSFAKKRYTDAGSDAVKSINGDEITDFEWPEEEGIEVDSEYIEDGTRVIQMNESDYPTTASMVEDPLKIFFNAMYASVKRLSKDHVFQVRRRIFEIVSEAEESAYQSEVVQVVSSKEEIVE